MPTKRQNTGKRKMQVRKSAPKSDKTTKITSVKKRKNSVSSPYTKEDIKSLATATPKTKTAQLSGTEKRKAAKRKKKIRKLIIALVILVLAALGVGAGFLYNSDYFTIEDIEFTGVSHLTQDEMYLLANVPEGDTLIRVDTGRIADRLKMDA